MGNCFGEDTGAAPDPEVVDIRHFDVEKEIGRGAFGKVHACVWKLAPKRDGECMNLQVSEMLYIVLVFRFASLSVLRTFC